MANVSRVNGFKPVKAFGGAYNGQINAYEFAVGETVPLFVGDAVLRSTEASTTGLVTVKSLSAHATDANDVTSGVIIGVVTGFAIAKTDPLTGKLSAGAISLDTPQYLPAGTKAIVFVADAPDLICEIQSTASYALADIGLNADVGVLANAASKVSGNSPMYINATSPSASASRPVHVVGYSTRVDNEAPAAYNKILVQFTTHGQGNAIVGV